MNMDHQQHGRIGTGIADILAELPLSQKVPRQRECLVCYVYRMWRQFGCGEGFELSGLYRTLAAVADTRLEERLHAAGVHNDQELVFAAHRPNAPLWDPCGYCQVHAPVNGVPWCQEVVRGSTAACDLWLRRGNEKPAGARAALRLWA